MILKAEKIVKSYSNTRILAGISLSVREGQSVAICGRSGEGKTTLLHILGSLEEPDEGEIEIKGQKLTRSNAAMIRNQHVGFIFQTYNLLEDLTTLENVLMPSQIARKKKSRSAGLDLLAWVGLETKADLTVKSLSGGERQRVAIARALCNDPSLILADEPTGNLDRMNARQVGKLLIDLKKALILVTHDAELAALCSIQYLLKDGQLNFQ